MKKGYLALLVVVLIVVATALAIRQYQQTPRTLLEQTGVKDYSVPVTGIIRGQPTDAPTAVPLYTGITQADMHVDATRPNNYFYTTNALLADVSTFFHTKLTNAQFSEQTDGFTADIMANGLRTNLFVSSQKPTIYPKEYVTGTTYVSVTYNLKPLPTVEELLK